MRISDGWRITFMIFFGIIAVFCVGLYSSNYTNAKAEKAYLAGKVDGAEMQRRFDAYCLFSEYTACQIEKAVAASVLYMVTPEMPMPNFDTIPSCADSGGSL